MNDSFAHDLFEHIFSVYREVVSDLMQQRNVVACGIGFKQTANQITTVPGLIVSVTRKEPLSRLIGSDPIPEQIDNIPTDVVETGPIQALGLNRRAPSRPARPGMSIGHLDGNVGTFGAVVQRDGQQFVLSNNHVLALLNQAKTGDPIIQPARGDGGTIEHQIGTLADFIPLIFNDQPVEMALAQGQATQDQPAQGCAVQLLNLFQSLTRGTSTLDQNESPRPVSDLPIADGGLRPANTVDVAIAHIPDPDDIDPRIVHVNGTPRGTIEPQLGMPVIKSGRTTGLTESVIRQINVTVDVKYPGRVARFTNQIMVDTFSDSGDSGSLVLDYERRAVGLLFSGSEHVSVITPIQAVLDALNVELVTTVS